MGAYVRFRSRHPRPDGSFVGVFGLVNVLGRHGMLTPKEEAFRLESNAWYDAAYPDPCAVRPDAYAHPLAASWFREGPTTVDLLRGLGGYLAILDAHRVAWERVRSDDPGALTYEDAYQVVAVPR